MTATVTKSIEVPYQFDPRSYQLPFFDAMSEGCKRAILVWHRRSGKDKTTWNWMIHAAINLRVGTYYYFFPTYAQAKKVIWDGMDRDGFRFLDHIPAELIYNKNETEMKITFRHPDDSTKPGSIIQLIGTDDFDKIVGTNPVGCVFSEYSLQDPQAWELTRPILAENGGWAVFVYTPRGKNHGWTLYSRNKDRATWFVSLLTVRDTFRPDGTPVVSQEIIDEEIASGADEETIQQEYYCSFHGGIVGAYYTSQFKLLDEAKPPRIGIVPWEPSIEVHTWWDLGYGDSTAIWFMQQVGRELRFIDYLEHHGEGLGFYAKELKALPYTYGRHYGPHDLAVHEFTSGEQRAVTARKLGVRFTIVKKHLVNDGINAVRQILPLCWFDEKKCDRGLSALRHYHKEWDEDRKGFKKDPKHDWSSHGADAFRIGAMGFRRIEPEQRRQVRAITEFDPLGRDRGRQQTYESDFNVFARE